MGDVTDSDIYRHKINGLTSVLIADVDDYLIYILAGFYDVVSLCQREDRSPLIPSGKLIRVERNDHLAK